MSWLAEYAKDPLKLTVFSFKLTYFNTARSKIMLDILTLFELVNADRKFSRPYP
jgi:hypothetical protein